jgi:hypothetical protein
MIDLTLILAMLLATGDEAAPAQSADVKAKAATAAAQADVDRPALLASEIKALRDSNIFAPYGRKNLPTRTKGYEKKAEPVAAPKPKAPVVTGIFFDDKMKCYLVVVEDRNEASLKQFKEPKFLKAGEEVIGLKVGPVTAEKATFIKGEVAKELAVGDSLPAVDGKSATPAGASSDDPEASPIDTDAQVEIKPLDTEEKTKVLEKMKKDRGKKNRPSHDDQ